MWNFPHDVAQSAEVILPVYAQDYRLLTGEKYILAFLGAPYQDEIECFESKSRLLTLEDGLFTIFFAISSVLLSSSLIEYLLAWKG